MQHKYTLIIFLFPLLLSTSCRQNKIEVNSPPITYDLKNIISSDTLRVATMYGSTSYFLYRDELMGFDYEMAIDLANYLKVNLKIIIAQNETEMAGMLLEHKVDIVTYNLIETKKFKKLFNYVLPQSESFQVLVQNRGKNFISDVTQLAGKNVHVPANSIFLKRLQALNDEIGGSINIIIAADSLTNDDLIEMVANKKIDYTLAYHKVALLYKSVHRNLNCGLSVGFDQRNGWLIGNNSTELEKAIESWEKLPETTIKQSRLYYKYWTKSPYMTRQTLRIPRGAISPFDYLFKKHAALIDWEWQLLAALAFHESGFDSSQVSWAGACGIMQLMPRTAANFGLNNVTILNPGLNIEAGSQYIKSLNLTFKKIENNDERIKFILAAYNSGPAHILDAMALATKYGKNPHIWFNQVEYFLIKKSETEFYNDPVVKYGCFRGKETVRFVHNILNTREKYLRREKIN